MFLLQSTYHMLHTLDFTVFIASTIIDIYHDDLKCENEQKIGPDTKCQESCPKETVCSLLPDI